MTNGSQFFLFDPQIPSLTVRQRRRRGKDLDGYLTALTAELEDPGKGKLDQYLEPFIRDGATGSVADAIKAAPSLYGNNADAVAGSTDDPALKARYEAQEPKRQPAQEG